jgi:hypothetical protein
VIFKSGNLRTSQNKSLDIALDGYISCFAEYSNYTVFFFSFVNPPQINFLKNRIITPSMGGLSQNHLRLYSYGVRGKNGGNALE